MRKKILKILWLASAPLLLALAFAGPAQAGGGGGGEHGGEHGDAHALETNPLDNFAAQWFVREEGTPPPFAAALFNFSIFAFLIIRFAGPSFARVARERHETIAKQLADSARLREEAEKKLSQYSAKLASLDDEIARLVGTIRKEADEEKKRILAEAEARAQRMERDAEQQIKAELLRLRSEIEREAVLAAVSLAHQLLKEKTTETDQQSLVKRFVKDVESAGKETSL